MTDSYRPDDDPPLQDAPAPVTPDPAPDPAPQDAAPQDDGRPHESDVEARARAMGWVDKETWEAGPKAGKPHRSAEEFLRVAEESGPVLKERLKRLQSQYDERFQRLERTATTAIERIRAEERAKFDEKLRELTIDGDHEGARKLVEQRIEQERAEVAPAHSATGAPPEVEAWVEENPWFKTDASMRRVAEGIELRLSQRHPAMSLAERLKKTTEEMRRIYPDEFGSAAPTSGDRPAPTQLNGGVRTTPARNSKADRLPAEAKAMAKQLLERGAIKSIEEYAEDYFSEQPVSVKA